MDVIIVKCSKDYFRMHNFVWGMMPISEIAIATFYTDRSSTTKKLDEPLLSVPK